MSRGLLVYWGHFLNSLHLLTTVSTCVIMKGTREEFSMQLMTVNDLSIMWQVSPATIYRLVLRGELAAVKVGGQIRFEPTAVVSYMTRTA